jgi:inner membrane protein
MLGRTHIVLGLLAGILAGPFLPSEPRWLFLLLCSAFAILPDIDHRGSTINQLLDVTRVIPAFFKHRGVFHSIWPAAAGGAALWPFAGPLVGGAFLVGYLSHLLSDCLTKEGVNFFHPLLRFKIAGFLKTGSVFETLVFLLASGTTVFLLLS